MASASSSVRMTPAIEALVATQLGQVEGMLRKAVRGEESYAQLVATLTVADREIESCAGNESVAGDIVGTMLSELGQMPAHLRTARRVAETAEGTLDRATALRAQKVLLQEVFSAVAGNLCQRYSAIPALHAVLVEDRAPIYALAPFGRASQLTDLEIDADGLTSLVKPHEEALKAAARDPKQYLEKMFEVTGCSLIRSANVQGLIQTLIGQVIESMGELNRGRGEDFLKLPNEFVSGLFKIIFTIENSRKLSSKDVSAWVRAFTKAIFFSVVTDPGVFDYLRKRCLLDLVTLFRKYGKIVGVTTEGQRELIETAVNYYDVEGFVMQRRRHQLELRWLRLIHDESRSPEAPVVLVTGSQSSKREYARCGVPVPWMPPGVADDLHRQLIDKRRELGATPYKLPTPLSDEALIALLEEGPKKKSLPRKKEVKRAASGAGGAASKEEVEETTRVVATRVLSTAEKLAQDLMNTPRPPLRERVAIWVLGSDTAAALAQWLKWYPTRRFGEQETIDCHAIPEVLMRLPMMTQYSRTVREVEGESTREVHLTRVRAGEERKYVLKCCFNSVGYVFHANLQLVGAEREIVECDDTEESEKVVMPEMDEEVAAAAAGAGGWSAPLPYVVGEDRKGAYINIKGVHWYPSRF